MKKLSLILALFLVFSLAGCGEKAPLANDGGKDSSLGTQNGNTQTDTGNSDGDSTNVGGKEEDAEGTEKGESSVTTAKTLYGDYVAENGSAYAFNESMFTYVSGRYCFRGTYVIKETEDGSMRILLTVKYEGANENALIEVEPYVISSGSDSEGLSFHEGEGYIKVDITKYFVQK